jgi:hypothetical protein
LLSPSFTSADAAQNHSPATDRLETLATRASSSTTNVGTARFALSTLFARFAAFLLLATRVGAKQPSTTSPFRASFLLFIAGRGG